MGLPVICALAKRHKRLYLAMANEQVRQIADLPWYDPKTGTGNVVDVLHEEPEYDRQQMVTYVLGIAYGCNYLRGVKYHLTRHLAESVGVEVDDIRPRIKVPDMEVPAYDVVLAPFAAAESRTLTNEEALALQDAIYKSDFSVGVITGGPKDRSFGLHDLPFPEVVNLMRAAKVVITVESFGGRLAAAVQPKHHIMLSTTATPLFMQLYGGETVVPFTPGKFMPEGTVNAVRALLNPH